MESQNTGNNVEVFKLFDTVLLKIIYRHLLKTKGKNVKIIVKHFSDNSALMVDWIEINYPIMNPRYVQIEVREISETGWVWSNLRAEILYTDIMNRFDHRV